jgi:hypothetical protein
MFNGTSVYKLPVTASAAILVKSSPYLKRVQLIRTWMATFKDLTCKVTTTYALGNKVVA